MESPHQRDGRRVLTPWTTDCGRAAIDARAAVTVVELVIVMMILAILTAAAAPHFFTSLDRYRAESAARRIAHDLRLARDHAQATSSSQTVAFGSPTANEYQLLSFDDPQRPGAAYVVDIAGEPYVATIYSVNFGGDGNIVFDGFGRPDSGGTVIVEAGGHQQTVQVDAESGKVTVP